MIISDLSNLEDVSQELSNKTATAIPHGGSARVYRDVGYVGLLGTFRTGKSSFSANGNDKVSSIRVSPGETWQICVDSNYRNCVLVEQSFSDITRAGLPNDSMSSLRKL